MMAIWREFVLVRGLKPKGGRMIMGHKGWPGHPIKRDPMSALFVNLNFTLPLTYGLGNAQMPVSFGRSNWPRIC